MGGRTNKGREGGEQGVRGGHRATKVRNTKKKDERLKGECRSGINKAE